MRRPLLAALTSVPLLLAAPPVAASAAGAGVHDRAERRVAALIASERRAHGLAPARLAPRLGRPAGRHARRIQRRGGTLVHRSAPALMHAAGGAWSGEVLARAASPAAALAAWRASAPHRAILLTPRATTIGVGRVGASWVVHVAA